MVSPYQMAHPVLLEGLQKFKEMRPVMIVTGRCGSWKKANGPVWFWPRCQHPSAASWKLALAEMATANIFHRCHGSLLLRE